ncbi:helix-turn-helix transcriptional regulator [Desulfobulbus rhabdoformis]|uniref:helix-turn-helix domain-containing protein n=1 Tax=Desulfobulbus rhabdoformis TaxID=34032 RepID=UPI001963B4F5|nr:helix-turn-helix transcriptional regulator [Desulfobulbus rhabdoformis]MBM9616686.1 helix-turn-helix transcriptional regulator [Desulfobulbus rhabdoformis]
MISDEEQTLSDGYQFAHTILNSISAHVAILDRDGFILETNKAWRNFAHQNDLRVRPEQLAINYLEICEKSSEDTAGESREVARGIRAVIAGDIDEFILDYPCHSPHERRWFSMKVTRAVDTDPVRVVVSHENITRLKLAEEEGRLYAQALQAEKLKLEEANTALKVLLKQREADQQDLERKVLANVRQLIAPVVEQLAAQDLSPFSQELLATLQLRLAELTKPFLQRMTAIAAELTPQEIEVASLIREGKTSQDIADRMHLSITTINFHRRNLRRKLGLNKTGTNLQTFLAGMQD